MPSDIGKFVGRYFQALACLSIASMAISAIAYGSLFIDVSFVFLFWAAAYLIRHRPAARSWTIGVCVLLLLGLLASAVYITVVGTDRIVFRVGGVQMEHPSVTSVIALIGAMAAMVGFPLGLLLTPQARREFHRSAELR